MATASGTLRVVSLVRRRTYRPEELESAKVDGGAVVLKRRDESWLQLPGTGANALSVRNTNARVDQGRAGRVKAGSEDRREASRA